MAVASVRFESEALGGRWITYQVILPECGNGPFPVVIQLHGLGDDSRGWIERTNLVRYAEQYPFVIAMPDGETSSYLNWKEAGRIHRQAFEGHGRHDLPNHLRRFFNVTDGPWAIGGLSMGGYGAMRLGLKYPGAIRLDLGPFISVPYRPVSRSRSDRTDRNRRRQHRHQGRGASRLRQTPTSHLVRLWHR